MAKRSVSVTVGIPVFNARRTLRSAVLSVLNQTVLPREILIVDDGSSDESLDAVSDLVGGIVKVRRHTSNRGLPQLLNEQLSDCDSDFFARMDADDIMVPDRLQRQVDALTRDPSANICFGSMYVFDGFTAPEFARRVSPVPLSADDVLRGRHPFHPTVMFRCASWRGTRYDPRFRRGEDFELWIRSWEAMRGIALEEPLLFYKEAAIDVRKYVDSSLFCFRAAWLNRDRFSFPPIQVARFALERLARVVVVSTLAVAGADDVLIAHRGRRLSSSESAVAMEQLARATRELAGC